MAIGEVVDQLDLRLRARLRRAVILGGAAGLLGGDLRALQRRVVVGVGGLLDHHGELEIVGPGGACALGQRHDGDGGRGEQPDA